MKKQELLDGFTKVFHRSGKDIFFSPGRINLIGEHLDYNGGHSFPCAISLGTYGVYGPRDDDQVELYSANMHGSVVTFKVDDQQPETANDKVWANYLKGMLVYLRLKGYQINHGFNLYINGELPYGAGLSSSASIEMLMGIVLKTEFQLDIAPIDLVKLGQKTENDFVGLNSGIMDQFAVGMSKRENAILLDCATLQYEYRPLVLGDYEIVIMSTNKKHSLAGSAYNERVHQCQTALAKLQTKLDITALAQLSLEQFDEYSYLLNDDILLRRTRHVVMEDRRTMEAAKAMQDGDLVKLGRLISASHVSLHYDYEVSGKELDTLAETAWQQPACLGARMIGGGFAGSAIAIVKKNQAEEFKAAVGKVYQQRIGYSASFYDAEIVDGARPL